MAQSGSGFVPETFGYAMSILLADFILGCVKFDIHQVVQGPLHRG